MRPRTVRLLLVAGLAVAAVGCAPPLSTPGDTGSINLVTTTLDAGYQVTLTNGTNTDPTSRTDYNAALLTWVRARLTDP